MKALKRMMTVCLLTFVTASLGYFLYDELNSPPSLESPKLAKDRIDLIYFHMNLRCQTCRKFESYTEEMLRESFLETVRDGDLRWTKINVEEKQNLHYVGKYRITSRTIIVIEVRDGKPGKWKKLDKIWDIVGDRDRFKEYIRTETEGYLKK